MSLILTRGVSVDGCLFLIFHIVSHKLYWTLNLIYKENKIQTWEIKTKKGNWVSTEEDIRLDEGKWHAYNVKCHFADRPVNTFKTIWSVWGSHQYYDSHDNDGTQEGESRGNILLILNSSPTEEKLYLLT